MSKTSEARLRDALARIAEVEKLGLLAEEAETETA